MNETDKDTILFSGGGMRGVAFIGVVRCLEEKGYDIKNYYGVSVGSMFALLLSIGFTSEELTEIVIKKNFSELSDINLRSFLTKFGLDTGNNIIKWIQDTMKQKGIQEDITFDELYSKTMKKLCIFAANLVTHQMTCFDYTKTPKLKVLDAIRMSMSIPLIFTPKKLNGDIHVDGGVVNNFPVDLIQEPSNQCLYFKLNKKMEPELVNKSFFTYVIQVFNCYILARKRDDTEEDEKKNSIIHIQTSVMDTVNFNMNEERKMELINTGYTITKTRLEATINPNDTKHDDK